MIKQVKIFWEYVYSNSFFFDKYREWYIIITKDYNHSRLVDLKQLLKTKAFKVFGL